MNKSEAGKLVAVNAGEDLTEATDWSLIFGFCSIEKIFTKDDDGVIIGTQDLEFTPEGATEPTIYLANQYFLYTTTAESFEFAGQWTGRCSVTFPTKSLTGDIATFTIDE